MNGKVTILRDVKWRLVLRTCFATFRLSGAPSSTGLAHPLIHPHQPVSIIAFVIGPCPKISTENFKMTMLWGTERGTLGVYGQETDEVTKTSTKG